MSFLSFGRTISVCATLTILATGCADDTTDPEPTGGDTGSQTDNGTDNGTDNDGIDKDTDTVGGSITDKATENGPGEYRADFQSSSDFFTQMSGMVDGDSPHNKVQIWYSSNIQALIEAAANDPEASFVVPEGTVSIKIADGEKDDGEVNQIVVMIKKAAGYDPDNGDWYYEMRDGEGNVGQTPEGMAMEGKIAMCIGCHQAGPDTDFLLGVGLK